MNTPERIVFLGDSITDGHTCALLFQQALCEANRSLPVCVNAGIGGDTAQGMLGRLDRDVLPHRPTRVGLSAGINDLLRPVALTNYAAQVTAIADRLDRERIPLLVFTTTIVGDKLAASRPLLTEYNAFLRKLARDRGYKLVEIHQAMQTAAANGEAVLEPDHIHLTFAGYRVMTRALLDALGHADVPVPRELNLEPLPGLIRHWRLRPANDPASEWRELTLPETAPVAGWWQDHERRRGFVMSVSGAHRGETTLEAPTARRVWFNIGGHLQAVRVNGTQVYQTTGWTGWHVGKERVPVALVAGANQIAIETAGQFVLTVTESNDW